MRKVYVDNGSTSFPKAPLVSKSICDFIENVGSNINRGGYSKSYDTALSVIETRMLLCEMFNFEKSKNVIFTPNITYSLNMIIKGLFKNGDHIIVTSMEHNAVMRPLNSMVKLGITYDRVLCNEDGSLDPNSLLPLIKDNTKAIIMTHASNVCGTILPIYEVSEICKKRNINLIVDAAQTAGVLDLNMDYMDILAFTGHKGLLGPQGIGGFIIQDHLVDEMDSLIEGGTGSKSNEEVQPNILPDKYESGTPNIPGIIGLKSSLEYIKEIGVNNILEKELTLTEMFLEGVKSFNDVRIVGKENLENRLSTVSLDFLDRDNSEISFLLDNDYGIMTRCGLHCSPSAHKTLNTYPKGTVRFSFGHFNTVDEVDYILHSLKDILMR